MRNRLLLGFLAAALLASGGVYAYRVTVTDQSGGSPTVEGYAGQAAPAASPSDATPGSPPTEKIIYPGGPDAPSVTVPLTKEGRLKMSGIIAEEPGGGSTNRICEFDAKVRLVRGVVEEVYFTGTNPVGTGEKVIMILEGPTAPTTTVTEVWRDSAGQLREGCARLPYPVDATPPPLRD